MSQAVELNFKSTSLPLKRKLDRKLSIGLLVVGLAPALYLYYWYINGLTHVRVPPKATQIVSAATAPASGKPNLAASSPKADDPLARKKTDNPIPAKTAHVGFFDSLMSVFLPSAEAVTLQPAMQPAMQPARKATKSVAMPTGTRTASLPERLPTSDRTAFLPERQPMTSQQKRLMIAEEGFSDVMALAYRYPDAYGFKRDDDLRGVRLGNAIPVYRVVRPGRANYLGQPVASLLQPAAEWLFPIILENQIRFMVQVRSVGQDYVLGNGSRPLAMVYEKILARWPASEGFHPQLVIIPNLPGYYFTIPELPGQNITDTGRMLDCNPSLSPATVLLANWR